MINKISFLCFVLFSVNSFSQKTKVNAFNRDFEKYRNTTVFDYIYEDFDSTKLIWVADITVEFDTIIPGMIGECFKELKEKANRLGASGFRVTDSDLESIGDQKFISISAYWLRMEDRDENYLLSHSNTIYLFGLLGYHQSISGYPISLNDSEFIVHGLTYHSYEFMDDQRIHLLLGSKSRGASEHIHIKDGMKPRFFYFNLVKGSFKNAWISEYKENYGMFLSCILKKESK